jgi:hypothetical protein
MANLVAGGTDGFTTSIFGIPHPGTLEFIQRHLYQATDTLTDAGRQFMAGAHDLYERFNGSHARRLFSAAARAATHFWQADVVRYLGDVGALQQAPPIMRRWLMAEPELRQLYHAQRCDGYSDHYFDAHPNDVGEAHHDYRRVMSGVVQFKENGDWFARTYNDDLLPDETDLTMVEKSDILDSWWALKEILKAKEEDPTSRFNAALE